MRGQRVLVRVDFNVSVKDGRVARTDRARITAALPTILWLCKRGARIILVTHLGRPNGRRVAALSTKPLARAVGSLLGTSVRFIPATAGPKAERAAALLKNGDVLLLENVRFLPGEERNDRTVATALAKLADYYVNDAFAASHRAHASVVGITRLLPSFAGFLLASEVKNLSKVLVKPKRPFMVIMGGVKIETKMPVIQFLLPRADTILVGGALANVLLKTGKRLNKKIILPIDAKPTLRDAKDIGPKTIRLFVREIGRAKTIVWNGPLGVVEDPRYAVGTKKIAAAIAARARRSAFVVIGGGDTIPRVQHLFVALSSKRCWISTGGGAMLEYLSGKQLPGIAPLYD